LLIVDNISLSQPSLVCHQNGKVFSQSLLIVIETSEVFHNPCFDAAKQNTILLIVQVDHNPADCSTSFIVLQSC
jgi:hypothetical protein